MASRKDKEKEQKIFNTIKLEAAKWYDANNCLNMLKVLFRDKIEYQTLMDIPSTLELLNALFKHDHLSSTNLTILSATITVTKHFALQRKIEEQLPSFPKVNEVTVSEIFSHHRQKLMKFGMKLAANDVRQIDGLYNTPLSNYIDSWSMITDLETRLQIKEGDMKDFTGSLETLNLCMALNALTEEIEDTPDRPSPSDGPHTENPSWMKDITYQDYVQLKLAVSKYWKVFGSINMLKILLRQFVPKISQAKLESATDMMELFSLMEGMGVVTSSNPSIIFEAVIICGLQGVEQKIKQIRPPKFESFSLENVKIKIFSNYRQKLIEFGQKLKASSIATIGLLHEIDVKVHNGDPWLLICALEEGNVIKQNAATEFVASLRENDMNDEADIFDSI